MYLTEFIEGTEIPCNMNQVSRLTITDLMLLNINHGCCVLDVSHGRPINGLDDQQGTIAKK